MQHLEEGEVLCKKCCGVGELLPSSDLVEVGRCSRCNGTGKLDWVSACMGKKGPKIIDLSVPTQKAIREYVNKKCAK